MHLCSNFLQFLFGEFAVILIFNYKIYMYQSNKDKNNNNNKED